MNILWVHYIQLRNNSIFKVTYFQVFRQHDAKKDNWLDQLLLYDIFAVGLIAIGIDVLT